MHKSIYFLFYLLLFCMTSCSYDEALDEHAEIITGELVEVSFTGKLINSSADTRLVSPVKHLIDSCTFSVSGMAKIRTVETRADEPQSEIWHGRIVQFDKSEKKTYVSDPFEVTRDVNKIFINSCRLQMGTEMQLFLLLVKNDVDLPDFTDMDSLSDYQINCENSLSLSDHLPMYGKVENVTITRSGIQGAPLSIPLTRLGCKINLRYNCYASGYKISTIRVRNIPKKMSLAYPKENNVYPNLNTISDLTGADVLTLNEGNSWKPQEGNVSFYLPANARGEGPHKETISDEVADAALYTFIELECENESDSSSKVFLRFYPGGNTTNDYNLWENYEYDVRINVWKIKPDGYRIDIEDTVTTPSESVLFIFEDDSSKQYEIKFANNSCHFNIPENDFINNKTVKEINLINSYGIVSKAYVFIPFEHNAMKDVLLINSVFQGLKRDGFYEVCSPENFNNVREIPDGKFKQVKHLNYLNNNWKPIPLFKGTYDGNGYGIKDLKIQESGFNEAGIFAITQDAIITGIKLENSCTIKSNALYLGGIVGEARNTAISQCGSNAKIIATNPNERSVGGLVGMMTDGSIEDCYTGGEIGQDAWYNKGDVGGIVGRVKGVVKSFRYTYSSSRVYQIGSKDLQKGGIIGYLESYHFVTPFLKNLSMTDRSPHTVGNINDFDADNHLYGDNYGFNPENVGLKSEVAMNFLNDGRTNTIWSGSNSNYPWLSIEKP